MSADPSVRGVRGERRFAAGAVAVFAIVFAVGAYSARRPAQLGSLGGITDEYFALGAKLRVNGTLGLARDEPSALRPPGYPALVAAVLLILVDSPVRLDAREFESRGRAAVFLCQAALLAVSASMLFVWLSGRLHPVAASAAALAFGLNPLAIAVTGLLHYDVLHWLLLISACWATDAALRRRSPSLPLVGAGVLWGVSNLVRPVTLLIPVFLLVALWLWRRQRARTAVAWTLALGVGMALALAPWTLRNFRVTGRLVAVADNPWATLWGQTARPIRPDPDRYVWFDLYERDLMPIFERVTRSPVYDYVLQNRHAAELEAEFRREALRNLRHRPSVYARNAVAALWSFNVHTSAILLTAYRELQRPPGGAVAADRSRSGPPQAWFREGGALTDRDDGLARVFAAFVLALGVLAAFGAWRAGRRGCDVVLAPAAAYACVAVTHALVFLHMMHYYVKLPLLLVGVALLLDDCIRRRGARTGGLAAGGLSAASILLTVWTLWA